MGTRLYPCYYPCAHHPRAYDGAEVLPGVQTVTTSGGWKLDVPPLLKRGLDELAGGTFSPGCDIEQRDAANFTVEEFERDFLLVQRPLLLRGAMHDWPASRRWQRKALLKRHGKLKVEVAGIPYAKNYAGVQPQAMSINRFVKKEWGKRNDAGETKYLLHPFIEQRAPALLQDARMPAIFNSTGESGERLVHPQYHFFILGPPAAGSPLHYHHDAWNGLVFGKKLFSSCPPCMRRTNMPAHIAHKQEGQWQANAETAPCCATSLTLCATSRRYSVCAISLGSCNGITNRGRGRCSRVRL